MDDSEELKEAEQTQVAPPPAQPPRPDYAIADAIRDIDAAFLSTPETDEERSVADLSISLALVQVWPQMKERLDENLIEYTELCNLLGKKNERIKRLEKALSLRVSEIRAALKPLSDAVFGGARGGEAPLGSADTEETQENQ